MEKTYKVYEGTSFDERTPHAVCEILSDAIHSRRTQRLRLFYGNTETGRDWMEEHDTTGYIGRSTGSVKIPLLIPRSTSTGGGAILGHCIVRITSGGRDLYRHPAYHQPAITFQGNEVLFDGAVHAQFDTFRKAEKYIDFITGRTNTKGGK